MADIDAFVQAEADALVRRAVRVVRHPLDLQRPRARRRRAPLGRAPGRADGGGRARHRGPGRRGRPARRVRRVAGGRGRGADGHRVRPPRRAAGRPAGGVDHPAVRADRARRLPARPRRLRRQGPDPLPGLGHPAPAGRRRPPAGQPQVLRRGRGGVGVAHHRRVPGRARRPAGLRPDLCLRHRDGRRGRAVAGHGHARARLLPGRPAHRPGRPALGLVRGRRPQRPRRAGRAAGRAQGRGRAHRHPGLVRRRGRPDRRGAGQLRRPAVRPRASSWP